MGSYSCKYRLRLGLVVALDYTGTSQLHSGWGRTETN